MDLLLLLIGLALLLGGGDALVRGASALAHRVGISPLVVGLTVVSFGTSAPELAVNLTAAWRGSGELSFGNVIGSNLANIGLIVGLTALLRPFDVQSIVVRRELPMMLLATRATTASCCCCCWASSSTTRQGTCSASGRAERGR
jgi:cation:H+ antiporter